MRKVVVFFLKEFIKLHQNEALHKFDIAIKTTFIWNIKKNENKMCLKLVE